MMLGTLVPAATAVAAVGLWPMWRMAALTALGILALFAALFAAGVVLIAEPGQAPAGVAMIVSAALLIVSWANEWGIGPLPLVSDVVGNLWLLGVAWALYRYPNRRLARGTGGCSLCCWPGSWPRPGCWCSSLAAVAPVSAALVAGAVP